MTLMKLRTLKDLPAKYEETFHKDGSATWTNPRVLREELKAEAIKWVKELSPEVIEWIKHFFNITDKDLK